VKQFAYSATRAVAGTLLASGAAMFVLLFIYGPAPKR